MNYNEAVDYLFQIPKFNKKTEPDNTKKLLDKLNNPQDSFKTIHVAGTNGKGSVCAFLSNVLNVAGINAGLFTSPHLMQINERIQINNQIIENKDFLSAFIKVKEKVDEMCNEGLMHPAFFEFLFAMACHIFCDKKVKYAVLETGLGGRLDATNTINNQIITIITSIGMDHMEILGDNLNDIAKEKAAIIRKAVPVVFTPSNSTVENIIWNKIQEIDTKGYILRDTDYKLLKIHDKYIDFSIQSEYYVYNKVKIQLMAKYQIQNASLAILALTLLSKDEIGLTPEVILKGIESAIWPGRMEEIEKDVIIDGAHNEEGIKAFIDSVNLLHKDRAKNLIYSAVNDKNYPDIIKMLCEKLTFEKVIVCKLDNFRAVDSKILYDLFKKYSNQQIIETYSVEDAYLLGRFFTRDDMMLFCVGSLYLAGEIKEIHNRK